MNERFVISVDLDRLETSPQGSLNLKTISYLGQVYVNVSTSHVDVAIQFLRSHFGQFTIYCNAIALPSLKDLISLLDNGATKLLTTHQQLRDIVQEDLLEDLSRLVLSVDPSVCEKDPAITVKDVQAQLHDIVGHAEVAIHVHDVHDWKLLDMMQEYEKQPERYPKRYVTLSNNSRENYIKAINGGHVPIIPADALTAEPEKYPALIPAGFLVTSILKTDRPDGLYSTVVSDERGVCLGLVYSNEESIHRAIETGAGVYYSRSHQGLWHKGATSGDTQELVSIGWDCDGDALRFTVRQKGTGRIDAWIPRLP